MIGSTGRVTNYADVDELMNKYGSSLPEETTIQDLIRRDCNGNSKYVREDSAVEAG